MSERTGLDDFFHLLDSINKIAVWVLPTAGISPVVAALAGIIPPWPNKAGLTVATSSAALLALIFVFQFLRGRPKSVINRSLAIFIIMIISGAIFYFFAFSLFVYTTPVTGEMFTKGYACTPEAMQLFSQKCPWLDLDELKSAEYEATRLWTPPSIAIIRIFLLFLWFFLFVSYSLVLAAFASYQSTVKTHVKKQLSQ